MSTYRDDALAALDVAGFFVAQGLELRRLNDAEYGFRCPFHEDAHASANVNVTTGLWFCHACNEGGSPIDFLMKRDHVPFKVALAEVGKAAGLPAPSTKKERDNGAGAPIKTASKLTEQNVVAWHEAALRNADLARWFTEHRGYTAETVAKWQLGWDGQRVTIPVRDKSGKLVNVRRYKRDAIGTQGKMLGLEPGLNEARLFPLDVPLPEDVLLVEGEWDMILAHQHGLTNTLTVTSGAGIWSAAFTPYFEGRRVTICYDNDEAGRKGAQRVARILSDSCFVFLLHIPNLPEKGDVTDFFVEQQRSADELRALILDASPYVAGPVVENEPEAVKVPLHQASHAQYRNVRLDMSVMLSGKAMTPFTIPWEFDFDCGMNNKKYCGACPMMEVNGHRAVRVNANDPATLALINVTSAAQYSALRALAKAHPSCTYGLPTVKSSINVEEMRLIAELDTESRTGESEYVNRTGYFLGHGLLPNRSYTMYGYSHPHPKTQATVHVINEAVPSQDNISAFSLTPELHVALSLFEPANGQLVEEKWIDLYNDMRLHVHRIQDRFDMQIAYDLVWHSAIDFYFNDAYVRRGWAEVMVMGDSGQGKTEMAMNLLTHYRMGERVQGEQSSVAGLMGGLEKLAETWMLSWGRLPLNDKRLVVIDETQGLSAAAIESLSDVRATGVAEITKIRTERTHSRCRLIWLANPTTGQTLSQHNQGVTAIRDLFKKPEDIRRLDFAITVASGDVDFARAINVRHVDAGPQRYSSELCRTLILWAWSRRADQITFESDATDLILEEATRMGRRYHPAIPLVEPADQRLKLARLSVAAAARVHSSDATGEVIVVRREHVAFVVAYLERIYTGRSMSYGEFSDQQRGAEELDPSSEAGIRHELEGWQSTELALNFFRQTGNFKKAELSDVVGWDEHYAKAQLKYLASRRLIRTTRDGYRKNAVFITLLRSMLNGPVEDDDEAPGLPF